MGEKHRVLNGIYEDVERAIGKAIYDASGLVGVNLNALEILCLYAVENKFNKERQRREEEATEVT